MCRRSVIVVLHAHVITHSGDGSSSSSLPPLLHASMADAGASAEEQLAQAVPNLRTAVMEAIGDLQLEVCGYGVAFDGAVSFWGCLCVCVDGVVGRRSTLDGRN